MRKFSLPCLLFLLFGLPLSRGFVPATTKANRNSLLAAERAVVSSQQVVTSQPPPVLQSQQQDVIVEPKPLSQWTHLWKNQKVILWTSMFVAIAATATKSVAWQSLRRNMLAGTVIFMAGDYGAQLLTHYKTKTRSPKLFSLDQNRFVISSVLGAFWAGICNPSVYAGVENLLPGASSMARVLLKMAISCSILSTAGNYCTMFFRRFVKQLVEIKPRRPLDSLKICIQSCNQDFLEVLKDDLKVWPLYDIVCFSFIPPTLRPLTNAFMASAWSMYMSIASAKPAAVTTVESEESIPVNTEENNNMIDAETKNAIRVVVSP